MSVLLIDDTYSLMAMAKPLANLTGQTVMGASDLCSALKTIEAQKPTAVISGLPLTDDQGMTLLLWVSARHPGLPVVVLLKDFTDELAQQAQWFGAMGTLAKNLDPRVLPCGLAPMLGLPSPVVGPAPVVLPARVIEPVPFVELPVSRHLTLVPPLRLRIDTDGALAGMFQGFGQVRGHRATLALDSDGALLGWTTTDDSIDVRATAEKLQGLIDESHASIASELDQGQVAKIQSGSETYMVSCCSDTGHHVHFVTVLADGGNRPLVELAHKRLHRQLLEVVESAVA
jgi:CheY-like chemotaxis protein